MCSFTVARRISMKKQVKDYLNYRRSLGFQLKIEEKVLMNFANYADNKGHKGHLKIKITNIDWKNGVLQINQTKFKKSRLVPLHITTINALSDYCKVRKKYEAIKYSNQLFVIDDGSPITYRAIQYAFLKLRQLLG